MYFGSISVLSLKDLSCEEHNLHGGELLKVNYFQYKSKINPARFLGPWVFWLKAVCCNHRWDKQTKCGSIKAVVSNHLDQCFSSWSFLKLMPHFDKLHPSCLLIKSPQVSPLGSFLGAYYCTLNKHIRNCSIFGVSSWPRHVCWTLLLMGYIMKSFFSFHKNKTLLLLESAFFKPHPCASPEILTWPSRERQVS